jgi:hypothetical protein
MPKEFYTEKDIEDMVKRGVFSLEVNDNVVLTDLAYEKANKLGMRLVRGDRPDNPPSAPVRPYITQKGPIPPSPVAMQPAASQTFATPTPTPAGIVPTTPHVDGGDLHQRIHDAVVARLGSQVDAKLLDVIITRVLQSMQSMQSMQSTGAR